MKSNAIINTIFLGTNLLLSEGYSEEQQSTNPNVVIILTDDQGYGDLACHNNPWIKTPAMDKLYSESVRFTNFHVSPTCAPTRGALMTGRYPNAIGTWHTINGRNMMWEDEKTIADYFSENGYKTAIFGKWHLGDNSPHRPQDRGFQHVLIHGGGGIGQAPDYWGNDYFDDIYRENGKYKKFNGYCTDVWFTEAENFIKKNKNQPFFVYISTNAPHSPFNVPQKYADLYKDKNVPNANFFGMITNIDENIAKFRAFLKREKLSKNTILIFMSDNGTAAGYKPKNKKGYNCGMRGKKGSEYEGGHRVPFFIYWPQGKLTGGRDINILCAHIDLLPTLTELCHLKINSKKELHGQSLVPLLNGNTENWPNRTLVIDSQRVHLPQKWRKSSVMTQKWRLVDGKELYDIEKDPGQKTNVADKYAEKVNQLRQDYDKWWKLVNKENQGKMAAIAVGSTVENPVRLSSHDWYIPKNLNTVWNQNQIRKGTLGNGYWIIDVKTPGKYEISLWRWPVETNAAITAPLPRGKALKITKAKVTIGGITKTKEVTDQDISIVFSLNLKPGRQRLQTWFFSSDAPEGEIFQRGAYYVVIKKI